MKTGHNSFIRRETGPALAKERIASRFFRRPVHALLLVFTALISFLRPEPAPAQTLYTVLTNGPAANRLNIVVLAEGYTNGQSGQFLTDATNAVNNLYYFEPYTEYWSYFNAFGIFVASAKAGSSWSGEPLPLNSTYFNSSYDTTYNYIITIPPNQVDSNAADGQAKVNNLITNLSFQCGLPMLLVNEAIQGGSGGTLLVTSIESVRANPSITTHESGHTLGKLGDEYDYSYVNYGPTSPDNTLFNGTDVQPNTTTNTNPLTIKWNAWIEPGTPIPTEETDTMYANVVGLFQGANYSTNNWYRPNYDCLMQHLASSTMPEVFCPVCSEALVKAIYQKVRPIDSFSPATNNSVSITNMQDVAFSVVPLQPATHNLSVQWYTNGTAITGATSAGYNLQPGAFTNGTYSLQALVHDPTPLVRNDPSNLLSETITWTLNVSVARLQIDSAQWLNGGKFAFRVFGTAPHGFMIRSSTNLAAINWTPLSTNNLSGGQFYYTNSTTGNPAPHFYRAQLLP